MTPTSVTNKKEESKGDGTEWEHISQRERGENRKNEETTESVGRSLFVAARRGDVEEVKALLQHPLVDPSFAVGHDWRGARTALREAAYFGRVEVVRVLLEDGRADPAADGSVALRWAARDGHVDIVSLLLEDKRSDPMAGESSAVEWAADRGSAEAVRILLRDARVDPTVRDNRAVFLAACFGQVEIVRVLLQDARVDGTGAIERAHRSVVPVLVEDELT